MWLIEFLVFFSGWLLYLDAFIILMPSLFVSLHYLDAFIVCEPLSFVSLHCFMPLHYLGAFL